MAPFHKGKGHNLVIKKTIRRGTISSIGLTDRLLPIKLILT